MKSLAVLSVLLFFSFNTFAEDDFTGIKGSRGFHDTYYPSGEDLFFSGGVRYPEYTTEPLNSMYISSLVASNIDYSQTMLIEWQTFDVYNASFGFNVYGAADSVLHLDLDDTGYGYLVYDFTIMKEDVFEIGIFGKALNNNSRIEYRVSYYDGQDPSGQLFMPQTVPLPNSMWLLLPALIGFIGFRRKHS